MQTKFPEPFPPLPPIRMYRRRVPLLAAVSSLAIALGLLIYSFLA